MPIVLVIIFLSVPVAIGYALWKQRRLNAVETQPQPYRYGWFLGIVSMAVSLAIVLYVVFALLRGSPLLLGDTILAVLWAWAGWGVLRRRRMAWLLLIATTVLSALVLNMSAFILSSIIVLLGSWIVMVVGISQIIYLARLWSTSVWTSTGMRLRKPKTADAFRDMSGVRLGQAG